MCLLACGVNGIIHTRETPPPVEVIAVVVFTQFSIDLVRIGGGRGTPCLVLCARERGGGGQRNAREKQNPKRNVIPLTMSLYKRNRAIAQQTVGVSSFK